MSSAGDTEVFIPEQACVITVPVHLLPLSITRKMSACPVHSDQPATFISPVELREKGTTRKPRPLTPGQFFLPVVTSNHKAFRILRKFLHSGESLLQFSDENSPAGSVFSKRKNSIILFNTQIFLIVRKAKAPDWPLEQGSSTPSECEAPPLNSPVKMQDDDIIDTKRSEDGAGAAEDHGKCAEVLEEREVAVMKHKEENESHPLTRDASTNTPTASKWSRAIKLEEESGVGTPAGEAQSLLAKAEDSNGGESQITENSNPELISERGCTNQTRLALTGSEMSSSDNVKHGDKTNSSKHESSLAKANCCKRLMFRVQSPSLININEQQDKSDVKGQSSELERRLDKTKASISAAEIADVNNDDQVSKNITADANEDVAKSKSYVNIETSEGQSSSCESPVEIIDVNDDYQVSDGSSNDEDAVITSVSKVESFLEKFESNKQRINNCINSQGSPRKFQKPESDDNVMETDTDCNDLIVVESSVDDKRHGNKTGAKAKREGAVCKAVSSSAEAKCCESSVEIIDLDADRVLRKSTNNANREATSCTGAKSRVSLSSSLKHCDSAVEIVDLNDDEEVIVNDRKMGTAHGRQNGDVANGCKRRISYGIADETNSDGAAAVQVSTINGSLAKRPKRDDDANFLSERKHLESAVDPNSQVKNYNRDVEIIEVDDDDDKDAETHRSTNGTSESVTEVESCTNERKVQRTRGNAEDLANKVRRERDGEILDPPGRPGNGVESSLEKIKSCKRHVSGSDSADGVESHAQAQITEDSSAKRFKSANIMNPGGETRETCPKTQGDVGADDQDDLINNRNFSREAESLLTKSVVEIVAVSDNDQVSRKSTQGLNQDVTNPKNDVNKTIIQTLGAKGPVSELQSSSDKNKSCDTAAEIVDIRDDDRANAEICDKSHVSEVQNESAAETGEARDERERALSDEQNFEGTHDGVCFESNVSEVPSAAEDRALAGKSYPGETSRDVTTSGVSGSESDVEDSDPALASFIHEPNRYITTSESCAEPQISDVMSLLVTSEHCESLPERQAFDLDQDGEFADQWPEAVNQNARGEEMGVSSRPTSPRASHEFDYMGLRREENINRIQAKLREMEEKLKTLMNSWC